MARRKKKACFLFYVYGYCLGLGTGVIAAILCWTEGCPAPSRALLTTALGVSVTTLTSLAVLSREKYHWSLTCVRSVVNITGLLLTAVTTCAGTFLYRHADSLFFLCGSFSTALYVITCTAFTINCVREQTFKYTAQNPPPRDVAAETLPPPASCRERFTCYLPSDPYMGDPFSYPSPQRSRQILEEGASRLRPSSSVPILSTRSLDPTFCNSHPAANTGFINVGVSEPETICLPVLVALPAYTEVSQGCNYLPPHYSEINMVSGQVHSDFGSNPLSVASPQVFDHPPKYEDIMGETNPGTNSHQETLRTQGIFLSQLNSLQRLENQTEL